MAALCVESMKIILSALSAFQILTVGYGLYLIRAADRAMDKSGVGDLDLWSEYNSEAGVSITLATITWGLCIILAFLTKQNSSAVGKFSVSVGPFMFIVGWSLLWFI